MKKYIPCLLSLIILSGCGPAYHLRKAIKKGAEVSRDTTWTTLPVITPEIKFNTTLRPVNVKDTLIARDKSGAVTKVFIHETDTVIRSVFIETVCPSDTVYVKVPTEVNTTIKAGKGFWHYLKYIAIALILGFVAGCMFWASIRAWLKSFL